MEASHQKLFVQSGYLRHEGLEEGGGDGLGADVASDPLHLLLFLPPGHLVPGHGGAVDDGGGGEGELGAGVGALVGFEGIASILIGVPENNTLLKPSCCLLFMVSIFTHSFGTFSKNFI